MDDICNDRDDDDNNEDYPGRGVGVTVGLSVRWHRQGFGIICACLLHQSRKTISGFLFLFFPFSAIIIPFALAHDQNSLDKSFVRIQQVIWFWILLSKVMWWSHLEALRTSLRFCLFNYNKSISYTTLILFTRMLPILLNVLTTTGKSIYFFRLWWWRCRRVEYCSQVVSSTPCSAWQVFTCLLIFILVSESSTWFFGSRFDAIALVNHSPLYTKILNSHNRGAPCNRSEIYFLWYAPNRPFFVDFFFWQVDQSDRESEVVTVWQEEQESIDRFQGVVVYAGGRGGKTNPSQVWNGFHKRVSAESGANSTDVHNCQPGPSW